MFFTVLLVPAGSVAVSGGGDFPKLIAGGRLNTDFSDEAEQCFENTLPISDEIITFNSLVKSKIFKSESANVITGSAGQLFYSETTDDFLNVNQMSTREIFSCAKTLQLISQYCRTQGADFVFAAVPNKNSVIGQYMPFYFTDSGGASNLAALADSLESLNVAQAGIYTALSGAENGENLYYKTDTHWNSFGAYIGFSEILNSLGNAPPQLLQNLDFSDFEAGAARSTDLSALLFSALDRKENGVRLKNISALTDEIKIAARGAGTADAAELLSLIDDKDEDFTQIGTRSTGAGASKKLFMLRDSFCRAMLPYFAYTYKEALFIKSAQLNAYVYDMAEYDDFVFEIVERNLKSILESRQLLPAPEREIGEVRYETDCGGTVEINTDYSDYIMLSGEIQAQYLTDDSAVYVRLTNAANESKVYEAFPAAESGGAQEYYLTLPRTQPAQYRAELIAGDRVVAIAETTF